MMKGKFYVCLIFFKCNPFLQGVCEEPCKKTKKDATVETVNCINIDRGVVGQENELATSYTNNDFITSSPQVTKGLFLYFCTTIYVFTNQIKTLPQ